MGNPDQAVEATSPADAAAQFATHAVDYFGRDTAENHRGETIMKIITGEDGTETRIEAQYE
jgi:hypothetical protein